MLYFFSDLEESSENESGDSEYSYLKMYEETLESGLQKETFVSRITNYLTNVFRSK